MERPRQRVLPATLMAVLASMALMLACIGAAGCTLSPPAQTSSSTNASPNLRQMVLADPGRVVTEPADGIVTISIENPSPVARELSGWRIEGRDWLGFQIVQDPLPKVLPGRTSVTIDVRVDPPAFEVADPTLAAGQQGYAKYRAGEAVLHYEVDQRPHAIALEFQPSRDASPTRTRLLGALVALLAVGAVALGHRLLEAYFGQAVPRGPGLISHGRGDSTTRLTAVFAVGAAAMAVACMPVGLPVCGEAGDFVGAAAHQRCLRGLGGTPLRVLVDAAPVTWLCVLLLVVFVAFAAGAEVPRTALARGLSRLGVFVALTLGLCVATGQVDIDAFAWPASVRTLEGDRPQWAALAHPLATLLALWALASYVPSPEDREDPLPGRTWVDLLAVLLFTNVWLGGGAFPPSVLAAVSSNTAGTIALSVISFVGCALLVAALVTLARKHQRQLVLSETTTGASGDGGLERDPVAGARVGVMLILALACSLWIALSPAT